MRQTIRYEKTYFKKPPEINQETFFALKREFNNNPNYIIDKNPDSFSQHFQGHLIVICICLPLGFIGFSMGEGVTTAIGGFSMLAFLIALIRLLMEGPSYATYVKERKDYFDRMSYAVTVSENYLQFRQNFYNKK